MWGYQPHFRIAAKVAADGLFNLLDRKLNPNVFLVGVLIDDRKDRHPIGLEPEDCGYEVDNFADVLQQAQHFEAIDPLRDIICSHPKVQDSYDRRIEIRALMNALKTTIRLQDESKGVISFCSMPVSVEGYRVSVVLQLSRAQYESYYALNRNQVDQVSVHTSLLNATINEFLDLCAEALSKPSPGEGFHDFPEDKSEIIRKAGRNLMYTPANAGGELEGLHGLFDVCNTISSLKYEGAEGTGRMLIARRDHPNIEITLSLLKPIRITNFTAVRKLLEISSNENGLLSDSGYIYALGKQVDIYDHSKEDLFTIEFTKHYHWHLFHAEHELMQVSYGQPMLPQMKLDKEKFRCDLPRIFRDIKEKNIEKLWKLVLAASTQKHGTMLVISSQAEAEAERLQNQSTRIEPIQLEPENVRSLTAIDGALLLKPDGTCYAIGVILDGLASRKGNPARGARYNSAIRYIDDKKECLAVIVSEDGSINLLPDLLRSQGI